MKAINKRKYGYPFLLFLCIGLLFIILLFQRQVSQESQDISEDNLVMLENGIEGKAVFIRDNNIWYSEDGVERQIKNAIQDEIYENPLISPDGNLVGYLRYNFNLRTNTLFISDNLGQDLFEVANTEGFLHYTWTNDSKSVCYSVRQKGSYSNFVLQCENLFDKTKSQELFYEDLGGCGGGGSDPSDHLAAGENIIGMGSSPMVLEISSDNAFIKFTKRCQGDGGIFSRLNKEVINISELGSNGKFSPDGKSIAFEKNGEIFVFDITNNQELMRFKVESENELYAPMWGQDGNSIYFSSEKSVEVLDIESGFSDNSSFFSGFRASVNISTLWIGDLTTGVVTKLKDYDSHNVKALSELNGNLIVVEVENPSELYEYLLRYGTYEDSEDFEPKVNVSKLNLQESLADNEKYQMIGQDMKQISYVHE
jgi:Tol biopolymer transport system component